MLADYSKFKVGPTGTAVSHFWLAAVETCIHFFAPALNFRILINYPYIGSQIQIDWPPSARDATRWSSFARNF